MERSFNAHPIHVLARTGAPAGGTGYGSDANRPVQRRDRWWAGPVERLGTRATGGPLHATADVLH